jgi:predicted DNA-binding transcriptional regulator YafY
VKHQGFFKDEQRCFTIAPYCLKVFKQRWYVLAASEYPDGRLLVYGLDRILEIERTDDSYSIPDDFSVDEYFGSYYGVAAPLGAKPELVRLKIDASQVKYFRSLPLHSSQREIETTEEYSIFEFFLVPTYELMKEIFANGQHIEVLSPQSLRNEILDRLMGMCNRYGVG